MPAKDTVLSGIVKNGNISQNSQLELERQGQIIQALITKDSDIYSNHGFYSLSLTANENTTAMTTVTPMFELKHSEPVLVKQISTRRPLTFYTNASHFI